MNLENYIPDSESKVWEGNLSYIESELAPQMFEKIRVKV